MNTGWKKRERNTGKKSNLFKNAAITACLGMSLTFTTAYAEENSNLETVFHVYIDGDHVGKIDNKEVAEKVIDKKVSESESEFENLSLTIGEEVSYVSEKVFNPAFNNSKVSNVLKDELSVKANTVELSIGGNFVGYFDNKEKAGEVVKAYKEKYADEKTVGKIEAAKEKEKNSEEPVKRETPAVDETIITDVFLSEEVSFAEKKSDPADVLTVKQGIKLLEKGTLEENKHQVKEGEVIGKIAGKYDLSSKKLLELNPSLNEDSVLQIGQEINVTEYRPFVDVIVKEETKVDETIEYETEVIESDEMYKGDEKVKQEGSDGKKVVHYAIEKRNGKQTDKEMLDEKVTKEAVNKIVVKGTKVVSSRGTGNFSWPAVGGYISSHVGERWGRMHKGIDIAGPSNRTIKAADNGVVVSAGRDGTYGNKVVINHNNGMKTIYAHLSSISVKVGQTVEKGSKLGVMGSTGRSTGIHLHFEVYKNGALQNPMDYL
ncbi:peptidase M23 [Virgibacillus indicus]|uniref:Peptidase M23 n=1 Tax=Virgibacillus indicus TaxID=2024554 RepID=A0A265NCC8_9BACI|nr:M23 family metallopeptidase [Virgibacillus indicus]OZU89445.1 peptidase M23 [Virgibacillus indicus]